MKAIEVAETGGPEVLTHVDKQQPSPGPGEVLIKAEAIVVGLRRRGEGEAQAGEDEEALLRLEEAVSGVPPPAREPQAAEAGLS